MNRPETRLVVDGEGTLAVEDKRIVLRGRVSADEGYVEYRPRDDTRLADDIVVVGRPRPGARTGDAVGIAAFPLDLDLEIDLGRDFRFVGEGFESRLAGGLRVTKQGGGPFLAKGTIRALRGTYTAFGQRLDIERGRLLFDGPIADPSLDIVALRKNQAVEAGIEITGSARTPLVRLTSNPPVPDSEKLAWLVTGGPAGSQSAQESAAISAATATLLSRGGSGKPVTRRLAERVGLDDISIASRYSSTSADAVGTQVVTLGKRVTDRLYVAFEQGLSVATNALRIDYVLSRYFTVSAFAGTSNGISLSFRRNWR
jgi:translocation and assembly module TamB